MSIGFLEILVVAVVLIVVVGPHDLPRFLLQTRKLYRKARNLFLTVQNQYQSNLDDIEIQDFNEKAKARLETQKNSSFMPDDSQP